MKRWISILLVSSLLLLLSGCTDANISTTEITELPEHTIYMYYIDNTNYELLKCTYELDTDASKADTIEDILQAMYGELPDNQNNLISDSTRLMRSAYHRDTGLARVIVNVANELNDQYIEVLAKAAITKTLCQLDYVEMVQFEIYDSSTVGSGAIYENYDAASFVDAGKEGNFLQRGNITLYFATQQGDQLLEYSKSVEITNNISIEQLVIESLIQGPLREGFYQTIPDGTSLRKISIKDGVCYVDLSDDFNNTLDTCMDSITIYSIVNSLCELPTVNKVQFLINGKKQELYRATIPFDGMFEREMSFVQEKEEDN